VLHAEATPESGFYFRSDHFNFAKAGVPALYAEGGEDLVEGGSAAGRKASEAYTAVRYHKPADEFDPKWNLAGTMQDLDTLYQVGRTLADGDTWPNWRAGNPFRAARATRCETNQRGECQVMTIAVAYWCVLIAALLPYLWTTVAKQSGERYDNRDPRGWIARQTDPRVHRANAAQLNAFEAFPTFARVC
jgi:hypothetical protein